MSETPPSPWIHIGECPVCVNGLVRIRACRSTSGQQHLLAICDECEAIWLEPNTDSKRIFPDAENARCPICAQSLFGPQSHWALPEDISASHDWSLAAIFEMPTSDIVSDQESLEPHPPVNASNAMPNLDDEDLLSVEDIATDGDAPALPGAEFSGTPMSESTSTDLQQDLHSLPIPQGDSSYGQDDPKPGC